MGWRNLGLKAQKTCFLTTDPLRREADKHTTDSVSSEAQAPSLIVEKPGLGKRGHTGDLRWAGRWTGVVILAPENINLAFCQEKQEVSSRTALRNPLVIHR